jgi:hypothetical protein
MVPIPPSVATLATNTAEPDSVYKRTLSCQPIALLTNHAAELTGVNLRNSEKNVFEIRRSAKRRVDLSRKPGFWIDRLEKIGSRFGIPVAFCIR